MTTDRFDLYEFRKTFSIPAANIRSIINKLGMKVVKVDGKDYVEAEGNDEFIGRQILIHAVLEFRATMDIKSTLNGDYRKYPIREYRNYEVEELTPALKRTPNKQTYDIKPVPKSGNVGITQPSVSTDNDPQEDTEDNE